MHASCRPSPPCLRVAAAAIVLLPAFASAAPVLPAPDFYALVAAGNAANIFSAAGSYGLGPASVEVLPVASVAGRATGNPILGAGFVGAVGYSFVVVGPQPDIRVPMFASFALHASAIGSPGNADASFEVSFTEADFAVHVDADGAHPTPADIFDNHPFAVDSGHIGKVSLSAGGTSFGGTVDAFADPYLFIDPAFLATHPGYAVFVSDGIGNVPPVSSVPEPEIQASLLLGLGLIGALTRFVKRRS